MTTYADPTKFIDPTHCGACSDQDPAHTRSEHKTAAQTTPKGQIMNPKDPILHRHADGTEHSHGGSSGFTIGKQAIPDTYGDDRSHSHGVLGSDYSSGPVVWSERD